jgi:hypothetical protein
MLCALDKAFQRDRLGWSSDKDHKNVSVHNVQVEAGNGGPDETPDIPKLWKFAQTTSQLVRDT